MRKLVFFAVVLAMPSPGANAQSSQDVPEGMAPHDPSHAEQPVRWCAAHVARNELPQALSDCSFAILKDPKSSAAFSNRGSAYFKSFDFEAALRDFDRAIRLSPTKAILYFNRGTALSQLGRIDQAIEAFTDAIRIDPFLAVAFYNLSLIHI